MGKTSSAVKNRYNAKAYDRINLTVKKGNKEALQAVAESIGIKSVNEFINIAIEEKIKRECPSAEYSFTRVNSIADETDNKRESQNAE